jgi:hypothetical protein
MSLNEIMLEIRRKTDKINDLRSKKIKDMVWYLINTVDYKMSYIIVWIRF